MFSALNPPFKQTFSSSHGNNSGNFNNNSLLHVGPKNTYQIAESASSQALKAIGVAAIGVVAGVALHSVTQNRQKENEKRKTEGPYKDLNSLF